MVHVIEFKTVIASAVKQSHSFPIPFHCVIPVKTGIHINHFANTPAGSIAKNVHRTFYERSAPFRMTKQLPY